MFQKLAEIENKFSDLERQLSDPAIVQNQPLYQKLSKERSGLTPLIETYRKYNRILQQLEENKNLLEENDEEIRKMVKEEITLLEKGKLQAEQELKL